MKTIVKPIEVISVTNFDGEVQPLRFRIIGKDEELNTVRILRIYKVEQSRIAGIQTRIYTCEIQVGDTARICELRYSIDSTRWDLYKI